MRKKLTAIIITAAVAATFISGCENFVKKTSSDEDLSAAEIAKGAALALEAASSIDSDLGINLSGSIALGDVRQNLSMTLNMGIETVFDTYSSHISENIAMSYSDDVSQSYDQTMEYYLIQEDDDFCMYSGINDTWTKIKLDDFSYGGNASDSIFRMIADGNMQAEVNDKETLENGRDAYVLAISTSGTYLKDIIDFSVGDNAGLFDNIDYLNMTMEAFLYVYADTLEPALISVSCDELGNALVTEMFGISDEVFSLNDFLINCRYNALNSIDNITVPEQAAENAENYSEIEYSTEELNVDFDISIDDINFSVPMKYSDLTACGWKVDDSADGTVTAGDYDLETMRLNSLFMDVYIYNFGSDDAAYNECDVVGICITSDGAADKEVTLSSGIKLCESTMDDVVEAYGQPSNSYIGESTAYVNYVNSDTGAIINLYFDYETRVLNEIDIQNVTEP